MKYRLIYFLISGGVILAGIFTVVKWNLRLGIDFKGGAIVEYDTKGALDIGKFYENAKKSTLNVSSVQKVTDNTYLFKLGALSKEDKVKLKEEIKVLTQNDPEELRYEEVGPTIGPELIKKTLYAMGIASLGILIWVAFQFRSIKFGASAILAMLHDSLVLVGTYTILGHLFGLEIDFLFVTAMLTILSFSVHDTIVVYDRIRENQRKIGGSLYDLANRAVTETFVRSLNNSFTIIFMLVALILLGGETIQGFAVALLIGTISGTYSSPFVAVPLLVTIDEVVSKVKDKVRR